MKKLILIFLWCALASANAAIRCMGPTATGNGSGSDWNNIMVEPPTSTSWIRGDTYYLADGSYDIITISTPVSGTSLITVKKATVADHGPSTGWVNTLGDGVATISSGFNLRTGYITLDGNGTHTIPSNNPADYGFNVHSTAQNNSNGVIQVGTPSAAGAANFVTIRYVYIDCTFTNSAADTSTRLFRVVPNPDPDTNHLKIQNCYFKGGGGDPILLGDADYVLLERAYVERGGKLLDPYHGQTIMCHSGTNHVVVRWNIFDRCEGQALMPMSAQNQNTQNVRFYGNVVFVPDEGTTEGRGFNAGIVDNPWSANSYKEIKIYNNTYVNLRDSLVVGPTMSTNFQIYNGPTSPPTGDVAGDEHYNDLMYNSASSTTSSRYANHESHASGGLGTLGGTNQQTGLTSAIFVNYSGENYRLASATTAGTTLTGKSWWNTSDPFFGARDSAQDMYGNVRGQDGTWDRGAFEFNSGGADTTAPTLTSIAIGTNGTTWTFVFNEDVTVGAGDTVGWATSMSGGAVTLAYTSGAGSNALVYTGNRVVTATETGTATYTQPGNGVEDTALNDLASISTPRTVNNGSTVGQGGMPIISPASGPYFGGITMTMTADSGASIYYTTDGSTPSASSTSYSGPVALSANVTIQAIAIKSGVPDSPIASVQYELTSWASDDQWKTFPVPTQTGTFTWSFRVTPSVANQDIVVGLGPAVVDYFDDMGPIIQFSDTGFINARHGTHGSGDNYYADNVLAYSAGVGYDVVASVNVSAKTYSVTVTPDASPPTVIATNYGFRASQSGATQLSHFGSYTLIDAAVISNMTFSGAADTSPPLPDPADWTALPTAVSESEVQMTAATGTDSTGPILYKFDELTGNAGGTSSDWQTSPSYVDTNLAPGTLYIYRVTMKDSASTPNVGNPSTVVIVTTQNILGAGAKKPPIVGGTRGRGYGAFQ